MAWTFDELAENINFCYSAKLGTGTKAASGHLTDADVGKPVKLTAAGVYALCADGDNIDGFLDSVSEFTQDGYAFGTVQTGGRRWVTLSGNCAVGNCVEAAAPAAARTAETSGFGAVSIHAGHALGAASTVNLALPFIVSKKWRVISGAGTNGTVALVEKQ